MNKFEEFGSLVFSPSLMKERLKPEIYQFFEKARENKAQLDKVAADEIASAMKEWAIEKGCTHYTHWFQPLTGITAEKHEAFISRDKQGELLVKFSGNSLIKGESDASSFPSGGLRATFEARGYNYWDVSSPVFIRDNVLCIPSIFVSYNGEALDKKYPLLKSMRSLEKNALDLLGLLGYSNINSVYPVIGLEQEYFLVDRPLYKKRLDLMLTGRTMFGAPTPKGQEMNDHYFGTIPTRVIPFMKEVDEELWKLGIYAHTEHNEAAPCQFELAPIFCNANIAVDQNQIIMDVLKRVAYKHGYACLLHEKPFNYINGSGKHNNYSLTTNTGMNIFDPGKTARDKLRFLLFSSCFIQAIDRYPELIILACSSYSNDYRLGANEAPPFIVSVYMGEAINNILKEVEKEEVTASKNDHIYGLPYLEKDASDRNRTSPIAFTGNKFEFRMLGSSMSPSFINVVLNAAFSQTIKEAYEALKGSSNLGRAIVDYSKKLLQDSSRTLFSGNCYATEWQMEAAKRGLPIIHSSIEAAAHADSQKTLDLFTAEDIFTEVELKAHKDVLIDQYIKNAALETKTLLNMVNHEIVPAMIADLEASRQLYSVSSSIKKRFDKISTVINELSDRSDLLEDKFQHLTTNLRGYDLALALRREIIPSLLMMRNLIDTYEKYCTKSIYPIPMYTDLLS